MGQFEPTLGMKRPPIAGLDLAQISMRSARRKTALNRMEGARESGSEDLQNSNCSFVWDENSQLYFHASSGFYHDPVAGWYYSSRDGSYYKFENGSYVILELDVGGKCKTDQYEEIIPDNPVEGERCGQVCSTNIEDHSSFEASEFDTHKCKGGDFDRLPLGERESINIHALENPPPTSLWLEDTLIDLFLSGYYNPEAIATDDDTSPFTINGANNFQSPRDGYDDTQRMEGEWLQEENHLTVNSSERILDGDNMTSQIGTYSDEDNWKAQYGQVTHYGEETIPKFSVVDIWDWSTVSESRTGGKGKVTRLVGRLVRKSAKLHPSLSSNSTFLKTDPICGVRLDLVQVATGKIYKLHSPSKRYLASMSTFNSSNPTKDWGFPDIFDGQILPLSMYDEAKAADTSTISINGSTSADELPASEKYSSHNLYRDRAAERRILYGGFGVGPGHKKSAIDHNNLPSSSIYGCSESIAAEGINVPFGAGSYARKILEGMGWKEGEGLGSSTQGLVEPIRVVENIGNAGLGWPRGIKEVVMK